nr:hypothetical protein Iba_chr05aCG8100 [Ipomoea batatas]
MPRSDPGLRVPVVRKGCIALLDHRRRNQQSYPPEKHEKNCKGIKLQPSSTLNNALNRVSHTIGNKNPSGTRYVDRLWSPIACTKHRWSGGGPACGVTSSGGGGVGSGGGAAEREDGGTVTLGSRAEAWSMMVGITGPWSVAKNSHKGAWKFSAQAEIRQWTSFLHTMRLLKVTRPCLWRAGMVVTEVVAGLLRWRCGWKFPVAIRAVIADQFSFPDAVLAKQKVVGDEISAVSR